MTAAEPDARALALARLRCSGWNATGFQVLERGFEYFFDGDDACVSYVDTGRAWVGAGAPIAPPERFDEVTRRFVAAARAAGRRSCFFGVERRFIEATRLPALVVGEQASWNPQKWDDTLAQRRSLREQLRRARAKGVRVRIAGAEEMADAANPCRRAVEALVERWLASRAMAAMGFLVDIQPFEHANERRYFVAEQRGELVGFLCAVPIYAREGWLFEDLLRDPHAPNGTTELLVDAAMRTVAREGSTFVTLGLAPLSGSVPRWLSRVRRWTAPLYDFDGIRAFKAKLSPEKWDPILLAYPTNASSNVALLDVLSAFARGSFVGFGIRTMFRGPGVVLRGLGLLFLLTTVVLVLAGRDWFPAPSVQCAWVLFHVLMGLGLVGISMRFRGRLALVLARSITAGALLTWVQAVAYNLPKARSLLAFGIIVVTCACAAIGALPVWGAVRRHGRVSAR